MNGRLLSKEELDEIRGRGAGLKILIDELAGVSEQLSGEIICLLQDVGELLNQIDGYNEIIDDIINEAKKSAKKNLQQINNLETLLGYLLRGEK